MTLSLRRRHVTGARRAVAILVCAVIALAASGIHNAASAATTVINFDEKPNYDWITDDYASRGVTFTGPGANAINDPAMARTDPNYIICGLPPGSEFCSTPLEGSFSPFVGRVRIWVGYISTWQTPFTVTLRAFNSSNGLVGTSTANFSASFRGQVNYPIARVVEVVAASNVIARFDVITNAYYGNVAHDDLEFERYEPDILITPNPADFGAVDVGSSRDLDISIQNSGKATLAIRTVTVAPGEFVRVSESCTAAGVPPGGSCTARVRFTPPAVGDRTGTIDITANTPAGRHIGRLIGRGQEPTPGTTAPPDTTTTTTTRPSTGGTTTTSTTVTIPTIVTIPPPTPGATLVVTPSLGPGGFVAQARGTGFPPNQGVQLGWSPGLGLFQAVAGPDGTFDLPVLVMHRDVIGLRTLVATNPAASVSATALFLVLPSTVQPSGKDVAQITRTRRFLNR